MDDNEFKLALFGVSMTMFFLGMRIFLDWENKRIQLDIHPKK